MLFNSFTFIIFFAIIVLVHYSPLAWKYKKSNLLLGSYIFYAAWNPPFVLLLFASTFVDWHLAKKIFSSHTNQSRKRWLGLSLLFNLGLLSVFKYSGFLLQNFQQLMDIAGLDVEFHDPGFILPMGISFYTFQTLSYTLDIYFRRLKPHHSFQDYALFVSFFPQLVAGPIVRAKEFLPQLAQQNKIKFDTFSIGLSLFIIGLFEKVVLADTFFAPVVNSVFIDNAQPDALSSWSAALFFYAQIFCDFSGYSLCAIGTALCLGFKLPFNFKSPLSAVGFSDFWRRWHISLSSWLRDYLYIPLGGSRYGRFVTFRSLMITMLLGGLWHGAEWTFVIWGGLHGSYLIIERGLKSFSFSKQLASVKAVRLILAAATFLAVTLAFVIFRAENLQQALLIYKGMFGFAGEQDLVSWDMWLMLVSTAFIVLLALQWFYRQRLITDVMQNFSPLSRAAILSACLLLIAVSSGNSNAFIYFQF
jgi:alginate O-acetyltransferase complex protein AlgI